MTDADRIRDAVAIALHQATHAGRAEAPEIGATIADQLRIALPDIPDPIIARVLVAAATFIWALGPGLSSRQAASGLALAAADLAHLDLETPPT